MRHEKNRAFALYLAGQGISSLGDSIRFISVTMLIFNMTGSGVSAGLSVVFSALPGIIASPFAGVLGDRTDERRLLVLVDFARFLPVLLLLYANSTIQIYLLLLLLSVFDIFYGPSRRKYILTVTGRKGALKANSMLAGVSGAAYLLGPPAAGWLTDRYGPAPVILTAVVCCFASCLMTILSGASSGRYYKRLKAETAKAEKPGILSEFRHGLGYCRNTPVVGELLDIGFIMGFCTICVNLAFYPYAFDTLRVTAKGWSLLITIFYGTNLIAVFIVKYIEKLMKGREIIFFYTGMMAVSFIWALYTLADNFANVIVLQFVEGSVMAVCGIILAARFQKVTERKYMARVSGLNDIFSSAGKLAGMAAAGVLTGCFSYSAVFVFNSAVLLLFSFSGLAKSLRR